MPITPVELREFLPNGTLRSGWSTGGSTMGWTAHLSSYPTGDLGPNPTRSNGNLASNGRNRRFLPSLAGLPSGALRSEGRAAGGRAAGGRAHYSASAASHAAPMMPASLRNRAGATGTFTSGKGRY